GRGSSAHLRGMDFLCTIRRPSRRRSLWGRGLLPDRGNQGCAEAMRARAALIALPILLAIALAVQLGALADRLAAAATGVALCTTGALHTSEEPPDLPLTRDYALLRIMLKDPTGQFDHMRRLYEGALRAPQAEPIATFLGKR